MVKIFEAIDEEISEEANAILDEARKFAREKKEEMRKRAMEDNEKLFSVEKKNITKEVRKWEEEKREKHMLEHAKARERIIERVWFEAKKKFLSMPKRKEEYKKFMDKLFSQVKKESKDCDIFLRKEDINFQKGAKPAKIKGGALIMSKDGKIELDYSFEGLLRDMEGLTKERIEEVLFG